MTRKSLIASLLLPFLLHAGEFFHYDFSADKLPPHQLVGNAKIADGALILPDHRSELVVPDSAKYNFAKEGTTLMMTCRFHGRNKGTPALQLMVSKDDSFFLGVYNNLFNFSLSQNGEWPIALIAGLPPPDGLWFHLAAVVRPDVEIEQGKDGIQLEIYINGNRLHKFVAAPILYPNSKTPVRIGMKGNWSMGEDAGFIGDIAEISMIDRALSPNEIGEALSKSKLVKELRPDFVKLSSAFEARLTGLVGSAVTPHARFVAQALLNAAKTGAGPAMLSQTIDTMAEMIASTTAEDAFVTRWNQTQKTFQLVQTERLLSLVHTEKGTRIYPVIALYDRTAQRIVSSVRFNSWKLQCRELKSNSRQISDSDPKVSFTISPIQYHDGNAQFTINWNTQDFIVTSNCLQTASRLEQDLHVENLNPRLILETVNFPDWKLARLPGKDTFFYPEFSGRLYHDPIREGVNLGGSSGNARHTMQFRSYYSDDGFGTYLAMEDPISNYRRTLALGMYGELELLWSNPVAYKADNPAQNNYSQSGKAVLEVFTGDWFDASMIYKSRFLPTAKWWIPNLPRASTPKWFRELPATILVGTQPARNSTIVEYMHDYLETPISVHLVGWSKPEGRIWPHFDQINEHGRAFLERMKKHDIKVIPYSDSILFSLLDGADKKSVKDYERVGYPASVKDRNGKPLLQRYGTAECSLSCPSSSLWRDYYTNIVNCIARLGFDGAYHDQECSCWPAPCFDPKHEFHDINDPAGWLLKGHMPMFETIRREAAEINKEFVHTGEDGAEPFLQILDGFTVWRFTNPDHVPALQAIYAGRIQFSGRTFNHQKPGDWDSSFIKFAEQLAYAEQLGWITVEDLAVATPLRTYFKKLCHLRQALVKYFTEATMLKPLRFNNMPQVSSLWGDAVTARFVTTAQVIHSSWQLPDGRVMAVFLNTMEHPNTVRPLHSFGTSGVLAVCREGAKTPEYVSPAVPPEITLQPYATEVWLYSPKDNREEAAQIASVMHKISTFDMGRNLLIRDNFTQKIPSRISLAPGGTLYTNEIARHTKCCYKFPRSAGGIPQGMLHTLDQSELHLLNLDFTSPIQNLEITAATTGTTFVELFALDANGKRSSLGKAQLKRSNKWMAMQGTVIPLPSPLQGKNGLVLVFTGDTSRFRNVKFL